MSYGMFSFIPSRGITKIKGLVPYILVSFLPLIFLLIKVFLRLFSNDLLLSEFLLNQREYILLLKTLSYACGVVIILLCVSPLAALGIWRIGKKTRKAILVALTVLIPLPFCIHTLVWMETLNNINRLLNNLFSLTGWGISVFVQSMALLPIAIIIFYERLSKIPKDLVHAAQVFGTDLNTLARIVIPQLRPAFIVTGIITFILTFNEYGIPSVFAVTTYSMEIFAEYSSSLSAEMALVTALPMLIPGFILTVPLANIIRKGLFTDNVKNTEMPLKHLPPIVKIVLLGFNFITLSLIIFPIIVLIKKSGFSINSFSFLDDGGIDILTTFKVCIIAAILAMPIMYLAAHSLLEHKKSLWIWVLILFPAVIPSSLLGAALINFWNTPILNFAYASGLMPILAVMIRFMPFGILILAMGLKKLDGDLMNAANMLVSNKATILFHIKIPLLLSSLLLALGSIFLLGLGELGATVMLMPPGLSTFTIRIYGYLHYGATEMVAQISLIILLIIMITGLALSVLMEKRRKINDKDQ